MSKLGRCLSWLVIIVSFAFIAAYLLKYGAQAGMAPPPPAPPIASSALPSEAARAQGGPVRVGEPTAPSARTVSTAETAAAAGVREGPAAPTEKGLDARTSVSAEPSGIPPSPPPNPNPPPEKAPRIQMQEVTHDFKEIYQLEEVTHEFAFTNTGNGTLTFGAVTASCGCAVVTPSQKEFAPGQQGTLKVTFNAGRYRDRVTKHIYVDTNDPVTPRAILTMTGVVKVEVEVTPTGIYTGRMKVGDAIERVVTITAVEARSFRILDIKTDHLLLTAEAQPVPDKPAAYQIKIRFGPTEKAERINAKVIIKTDLPHAKELPIPVFGRVGELGASNAPPSK